jgi:hypothetical protein
VADHKELRDLISAVRDALGDAMCEAEDTGLSVVWRYLYDAENVINDAANFIPTEL